MDRLYITERPQNRVVLNENWDQKFSTTIVKRKIRKLGYVCGVARKKVAARKELKREDVKW